MSPTKDGLLNDASPTEILVIDDSTANLKLMEETLTAAGYRVRLANEGELALHSAMKQPPALVLLDIRMPGMDGYEVCRRLKADERTREVPVIFISILEDERDKVKGFREGGVDYITKPFQPEEALARIQTHLRLRELTEQLELKVAKRTGELETANQLLRQEIAEHKRVEEALSERVTLAELSADIGYSLTMQGDLRIILKKCAEALVRRLDVAFARIWTFNAAENVLELQASAGMYTAIDGSHRRVPLGGLKVGLIAQERRPLVTNAVIGDPRVHDQEWAKREGMVAFAGHPLMVEERLVGVMGMFSRHPLTDVTIRVLASVSNGIAIGIERKRAEEELSRLNEELEERVRERTKELELRNYELEQMNKVFIGRELKMAELKEKIRELEK